MSNPRFTDEQKLAILDRYWKFKDSEQPLSLVDFAGVCGISYYVMRDWYRDPRFNRRWKDRHSYCTGKGKNFKVENSDFKVGFKGCFKVEDLGLPLEKKTSKPHASALIYNGRRVPTPGEPYALRGRKI